MDIFKNKTNDKNDNKMINKKHQKNIKNNYIIYYNHNCIK